MDKKRKSWFQTENIHLFLLYKIIIALIGVLLAQVFFHICANSLYHIQGFATWIKLIWGNIVYGLAAVTLVLSPYIILMVIPTNLRWKLWYRIICETWYIISILFLIIFGCCDAAYFQHTYRLISGEFFTYMEIGGQMGSLIPLFIRDYWPVGIAILICSCVFLILGFKISLLPRRKAFNYLGSDLIGMVLCLAIAFICMRGGFHKDFISLKDAARYGEPKYSALMINSGYSMIRTFLEPQLSKVDYMSQREANQLFNPDFKSLASQAIADSSTTHWEYGAGHSDIIDSIHPAPYKNVVILLLESFSQEYMKCYNPKLQQSFTPFLDSLAAHSIVYQGRSNGKKSIESIPAVTASLPTLMEAPFIISDFKNDSILGLPEILKRYGFTSGFFHGGYNGTLGFDTYCKKIGFDEYLGQDEYLANGGTMDNYDGAWGIFDEPFLQYTANHLSTYQQPFFGMIFTISSHHPFAIPEQYTNVFPKGDHPLLECVAYSDHAIKQFFETASQTDWYNNTLFIITGDHPGYGFTEEFNDYDGWYRTPMIIYDPTNPTPMRTRDILQQIDLMPTLIDYWALDERCVCFGNSVFQRSEDNHGYHIVYGNGFHVLNYAGGPAIIEGKTEIGDADHLKLLKAIIQQYNQRVVENKLR